MPRLRGRLGAFCARIAFWLAILLGLGYPVVLAGIAGGFLPPEVLLAIVMVHVGALRAGHGHRRRLGTG